MLYSPTDYDRIVPLSSSRKELKLRPPIRRDYARLIHSPAFRRLQGKTQLFPGVESDFFRNRLTHSIEVAQIAKSIGIRLNESSIPGKKKDEKLNLDLLEFAGLAHDLGHPPFGHNGEHALDSCMKDDGGFEGNAQTLRILTRLEKKGTNVEPFSSAKGSDSRNGLNLTYRTLAAVLKYNQVIPIKDSNRPEPGELTKGYYESEKDIVKKIKNGVIGESGYRGKFKTIECQIMDLADDIAYSTYDLEDALKAGFISPIEILKDSLDAALMTSVAKKVSDRAKIKFHPIDACLALYELFFHTGLFPEAEILKELAASPNHITVAKRAVNAYESSQSISENGYYRNSLTSTFVDRFIKGIECTWNPKAPAFSKVTFSKEVFPLVETLKNYTYEKQIQSARLKIAEYRGSQIVTELFNTLYDGGASLLPNDFKAWYDAAPNKSQKKRVICDFIAGMTDNYALEFYCRLNSENPQSFFKPI